MGAGPLPANPKAKAQLEKIRTRIKAAHFCIAASGSTVPKEFAKNIAEQLTRHANGFGNALAASLSEHALGNIDAAITAYKRAIELMPSYTAAYHDLAIAFENKMKTGTTYSNDWCRKALEAWQKTYELAPNDPGFSADYIVTIGQRISWLKQKCGKGERDD